MELTDVMIDRWLTRGAQLFRTLARNPVVRSALRARGLTDEELNRGWTLYGAVLGFHRGTPAHPTPGPTEASLAVEELDAWDQRWFGATSAILQAPFPSANRFLFDNLKPEAASSQCAPWRCISIASRDPSHLRCSLQTAVKRKIAAASSLACCSLISGILLM